MKDSKETFKKHQEFEARANEIEKNICWWENELDKAVKEYEALSSYEDVVDSSKLEEAKNKVKNLLNKAQFEKREMAKLESDINAWAVESAFAGRYSKSKRKTE